jgi:hypothetical protein
MQLPYVEGMRSEIRLLNSVCARDRRIPFDVCEAQLQRKEALGLEGETPKSACILRL